MGDYTSDKHGSRTSGEKSESFRSEKMESTQRPKIAHVHRTTAFLNSYAQPLLEVLDTYEIKSRHMSPFGKDIATLFLATFRSLLSNHQVMVFSGELSEKTLKNLFETQPPTKTNREILSLALDSLFGSDVEVVKKMIELSKPGPLSIRDVATEFVLYVTTERVKIPINIVRPWIREAFSKVEYVSFFEKSIHMNVIKTKTPIFKRVALTSLVPTYILLKFFFQQLMIHVIETGVSFLNHIPNPHYFARISDALFHTIMKKTILSKFDDQMKIDFLTAVIDSAISETHTPPTDKRIITLMKEFKNSCEHMKTKENEKIFIAGLSATMVVGAENETQNKKATRVDSRVSKMFETLDLGDWLGKVQDECIDFETLLTLDENSLEKLGLPLGPRQKLLRKLMSEKLSGKSEKYFIKNVEPSTDLIGSGHFGSVLRGTWNKTIAVALKKLFGDQLQEFLSEVELLMNFRHPNVLTCFGIWLSPENEYFMVTELAPLGNVKHYLISHQTNEKEKLMMCSDVAAGMAYLHSNNIIHRDLAARNLLIKKGPEGLIVLVSDFGLSRSQGGSDYYRTQSKQMPYKWTAIESILTGVFTKASDVWSFGVVLFEVFSEGQEPYFGLNVDTTIDKVKAGLRLESPQGAPQIIFELMKRCFSDSKLRPSFVDIFEELHVITKGVKEDPPIDLQTAKAEIVAILASTNSSDSKGYSNDYLITSINEIEADKEETIEYVNT